MKRSFNIPISLSLLILLNFEAAWSAACCGGSFAAPTLISSDDRAQVSFSSSYMDIRKDVSTEGYWIDRKNPESLNTFKFDAAWVFLDRWQSGLSLPVIRRAQEQESATGLGDINLTAGYEWLPDWDYNPWRPKGLVYFQLTVPTGRSIHESQSTLGLDARGRGFWAAGLGSLLTKSVRRYDFFLNTEVHRAFGKSVETQNFLIQVKPSWGVSATGGIGYNLKAFRFGSSLQLVYENPVKTSGSINSDGALQRFVALSTSLSYLYDEVWSTTISYTDQGLLGSPFNTALGQVVALQVQRKWQR